MGLSRWPSIHAQRSRTVSTQATAWLPRSPKMTLVERSSPILSTGSLPPKIGSSLSHSLSLFLIDSSMLMRSIPSE